MVVTLIKLIRDVRANLKLANSDRPEKVILHFDDKLRKDVKRALTHHHGKCDLPSRVMKVLLKSHATKAAVARGVTSNHVVDDNDLKDRLGCFFHWLFVRDFLQDVLGSSTVPSLWWQCEVNQQLRPASSSRYSFMFVLQLAVNTVCEEYLKLLQKIEPAQAAKVVRRSSSSSSLELVHNELRWKFQIARKEKPTSEAICPKKQVRFAKC